MAMKNTKELMGFGLDNPSHAEYMEYFGKQILNIKDGDYQDENGVWHCGKCGEPKQELAKDDLEAERPYLFIRDCACRRREIHEWERQRGIAETKYRTRGAEDSSYIPAKHRAETFGSWDQDTQERFNLYQYCMNFCLKQDRLGGKGICFIGDIGVGKSFAAAAIANWFMEQGSTVAFITAAEYTAAGKDGKAEFDRRIRRSKLVVLDDYGAERQTDAAREDIFNFVNEVIEGGKVLLVTSNYTKTDFNNPRQNARVMDRILGNCIIKQVEGDSMRKAAFRASAAELDRVLNEPLSESDF